MKGDLFIAGAKVLVITGVGCTVQLFLPRNLGKSEVMTVNDRELQLRNLTTFKSWAGELLAGTHLSKRLHIHKVT